MVKEILIVGVSHIDEHDVILSKNSVPALNLIMT